MKKKLKKIASAPKKIAHHVYRRRGTYGVVVGMIAGGVIIHDLDNETCKEAMAFIKLKGLTDEFFDHTMDHDWQELV